MSGGNQPPDKEETNMVHLSVLTRAGLAGVLTAGLGCTAARADTTLTFVWHAGTCADAIVEIAKDYPDKSVKIVPALVPYGPEWHNKIASEFAIKGDRASTSRCGIASPRLSSPAAAMPIQLNKIFDKSSALKAELFDRGIARALRRISRRVRQVLGLAGQPGRLRPDVAQGSVRGSEGEGGFQGQVRQGARGPADLSGRQGDRRVLHAA